MYDLVTWIYHVGDPLFLAYFSLINLVYAFLFILGAFGSYRRVEEVNAEDFTSILRSNSLPEITFIVPTYNDDAIILKCVENLVRLSYRYKKIIVVNDGSQDTTLDLLTSKFKLKKIPVYYKEKLITKPIRGLYRSELHKEVIVIDKENGEKFDALNAGLNACQTTYYSVIDSDTYIEDSIFEGVIRPLLASPDTVAIGSAVRVKNGCKVVWNKIDTRGFPSSFLSAIQAIEYLRAFLMREGWDIIRSNYILSGAFGIFVKDVIIHIGGYGPTIANDLEIILRLNRLMRATKTPFRVVYLPDPVAWTYVPSTLEALAAQRLRWHRGLLESIWFHRKLFFNPKYGLEGLFVYPFLIFCEAIEPIVEGLGYIYIFFGWLLGFTNPSFMLTFVLITMGWSFIQTLFSLWMEEFTFRKFASFRTIMKLFFYSIIESFGYRQLTVIWRIRGFTSFFKRYSQIKMDARHINETIERVERQGFIRW